MAGLLALGFFIGMRHAFEADHVAAVATLSAKSSSGADCVRQGVLWGIGHTLTLFLFGTIVLLVDNVIPTRLAAGLELAVGIMLVVLGFDVLRRARRDRVHFHLHDHASGVRHLHAHAHRGEGAHPSHEHAHAKTSGLRALMIGLMHGMAGSAALILLTLETTSSVASGMLYMLLFGIGSTLGMGLLSAAIAVPFRLSANGLNWLRDGLQWVVGVATIVIGTVAIYESGAHAILSR